MPPKLDPDGGLLVDSPSMRTRQMMRKLSVVGAAVGGVLLTASVAGAQDRPYDTYFGHKGEFVFSADRLVPVLAFTQNKITDNNSNPNTSTTTSGSAISLLWGNNSVLAGGGAGGGLNGAGNSTFYTTPRLGFDYVVVPNLTIGGDLFVFFTLGGSTTTTTTSPTRTVTNSQDNPSGNAFGIAPRVGYVFGINDLLSFWLRGGFSFYHAGTSVTDGTCLTQSDTSSVNVFGLDFDPQLVISPTSHFAFIAGPAIDVGFAGGFSASRPLGNQCNTTVTTSDGYSSFNIGLTGGLMGWF